MLKRSLNISEFVFRRNIPSRLETYVFNCEMLLVLTELDGIKTVAAVAGDMNKPVGELATTLAALYQRKLISIVKPGTVVFPRSIPKLPPPGDTNTLLEPGQRLGRSKEAAEEKPMAGNMSFSTNHRRKLNAASILMPINHIKTSNPTINKLKPQWTPPAFKPKGSDTAVQESRVDIFSINRPVKSGSRPSFSTRPPAGTPPAESRVVSLSGDDENGPGDSNALKHFEKGLAFLRRREYGDALQQFERSLEIDPQNRLCRANIQRIRKLLERENAPFKGLQ